MIKRILRFLFGSKHERDIKELQPLVDAVNSFNNNVAVLSDQDLQAKTTEFKQKLSDGAGLDSLLPEAFAVVRETAWRLLGEKPYDSQVMGGIVLHQGRIAEMKTGEGKTLTATMPVYLNALTGRGVHIVTVNDYLARRDSEWMGPIYEFLGLSVGTIQHNMPDEYKKPAYECDIIFGTNNEFGFDYLRDNMVMEKSRKRQRDHHYAIVDEVDSVLIDEARTPLIISGPSENSTDKYYRINRIMRHLRAGTEKEDKDNPEVDFVIDEKARTVTMTEEGTRHVEKLLEIDNLYDNTNVGLVHHVNQALKAHHLFKADVDYVVKDGEILIVDEFTGRLMPGRRFSEGLHQALEAKEGVPIKNENQTLATVTFQNYFRMYEKLSGMTGTADTEAVEFQEIYKLDVVVIPTNKPCIREDETDKIYRTNKEKFDAIVQEITETHAAGQPVLVGTISIENSEKISKMLKRKNVQHNVLNAKFHGKEAEIVKQAGRPAMVTIATNMAGRGTDIVLGGYPEYKEHLALHTELNSKGVQKLLQALVQNNFPKAEAALSALDPEEKEEGRVLLFKKAVQSRQFDIAEPLLEVMELQSHKKKMGKILNEAREWKKNNSLVLDKGGLYILGTERHESRRIDNQLRGRSGRQGDPGRSCFYISLEDDLMRLFGSERISAIMANLGMTDGQEIQHPWISKSIANAQKKVESRNFDIRKHLLEYDNVMNDQREFTYKKREQLLAGEDVQEDILSAIHDTLEVQFETSVDVKTPRAQWDLDPFLNFIRDSYGLIETGRTTEAQSREDLISSSFQSVRKAYKDKETRLTPPRMRELERFIFLQVLDTHWKDHLYAMDTLKEGIGLRGYAQKDPLIEYKFEAFNYFKLMLENVKKEVAEFVLKMELVASMDDISPQAAPAGIDARHQAFNFFGSQARQPAAQAPAPRLPAISAGPKVGRNDLCPCGSGKKYKHCHGRSS